MPCSYGGLAVKSPDDRGDGASGLHLVPGLILPGIGQHGDDNKHRGDSAHCNENRHTFTQSQPL